MIDFQPFQDSKVLRYVQSLAFPSVNLLILCVKKSKKDIDSKSIEKNIFKRYVLEVLCASLLPGVGVLPVGGTIAEFLCAGLASPRSLRARAPKASLSRALILLLLLSLVLATFSTLGLVLSPGRSPLWFLRCSLSRLRAPIRSSADEFGKWRNNKISRIAVRRRCDVSASGFRGGASWS